MSDVAFDGGRFPLADVQENPARYVKRLERAKIAPGHAVCLCATHDTPLQLVIRRYGSLLHLAGWPDDGHRHTRGCAFHKDPNAAKPAGGGDSKAAIIATPAGLNVKLDASLTLRETNSGSRASPAQTSNRPGRRSATLLAFLQTLWCEARLNEWTDLGTTRHWGQCNAQLLAELSTARINGADAQTVLHVMRRFEEADRAEINAEFDSFIARLSATHRGLVIGEISEVTPTQYGHALSLRQSARKYYASTTLIDHAARAWPHAWRALGGDRAARVVAILLVERTSKGHLKLLDLAAMLCSSAFIPCDSIHEVAMANRLVAERRDFLKPVRMSPQDDMLPDFVLRDAGAQTHVEVYGMNGVPAYERRKEEKRALRLARGIPAVEWDVDREPLAQVQLPPLRDARAT
ncbi:DUF1173 family protein [Paraburkholderia atlantica]|uniref:DUF1173 family protein n=1 Tax=Paraburkholderia atlantica TaxID=2654982 RepID=D5WNW6_PARAM|nr:DUF1173 family protein [Paraburkholderia atlantica]ADG20995.1 protein of unknown function DUF1173 [Paraburkholderia atlantica]MBB5510815.1 hypothetical protein [Paraburkholderia atlantica]